MMIRKIGIENFRVFRDYTEFEIRPVTILTGPNSSGKSSFTKLMLLLKNGVLKLHFEKGDHNLRDFESNLPWEKNRTAKLIVDISTESENFIEERINLEYSKGVLKKMIFSIESLEILRFVNCPNLYDPVDELISDYQYNIYLEINNLARTICDKRFLCNGIEIAKYTAEALGLKKLSSLNLEGLKIALKLFKLEQQSQDYSFDVFNDNFSRADYELIKSFIFLENENEKKLRYLVVNNMSNSLKKDSDYLLFDLFDGDKKITNKCADYILEGQSLKGLFYRESEFRPISDLKYIAKYYQSEETARYILDKIISDNKDELDSVSDLKLVPSQLNKILFDDDLFLWEEVINKISLVDGYYNDIEYLKVNRGSQQRIFQTRGMEEISRTQYRLQDRVENYRFKEFMKKVQNIFELPGEIELKTVENVAAIIYLKVGNKKLNLADVGYGYSQLIPIILKIINIKIKPINSKPNIIIIEEPEANLHPKLQSKLADFFALIISDFPSINLVIETHSEYLIRKLQYLTAKKEISKEKSIIYYFNDDKYVIGDEPKVKRIEITETGGLTDTFGPGFFDETTSIQIALARLNKSQKK